MAVWGWGVVGSRLGRQPETPIFAKLVSAHGLGKPGMRRDGLAFGNWWKRLPRLLPRLTRQGSAETMRS